MKKRVQVVILLSLVFFTACKDLENPDKEITKASSRVIAEENSEAFAELSFNEDAFYDFGTIKEGDVVEHEYFFKNTGELGLKVIQAKPSCGCTVSDWTKGEIAPGEEGSVTVQFDSRGRRHQQNKSVRLITNTKNGNESVRFTAFVE